MHYRQYVFTKVQGTITLKAFNSNTIIVSKQESTTNVVQLRLQSFKEQSVQSIMINNSVDFQIKQYTS